MNIQDVGGVRKTVDRAVGVLKEMLPEVNRVERVPIPVSEIILGTNCGGSDGNSGVTANPALGYASDLLVAHGGTSILAETPEIYGGEHLLTRRAVSPEVGEELIGLIKWWEKYTGFFGAQINNNPSVGNKKGGLTTIYEKSLGAIAKGGTTALRGVYRYAEPVTEARLRLHGHTRLRPGVGDRARRRRGKCGGLHDRTGKLLRLQTGPVDQGRDEYATL